MKLHQQLLLTALAGVTFGATSISAAELGMDAPPLKLARFVKGDAVELAQGKGSQVYVVEFWATWCGPCRTSIPHLTELQKRFKDQNVTIIGISDETAEEVEPFVKDMGAKMDYVVAVDQERATFAAYMEAFKQGGIPTAFVVDRAGKVVWYGHPMAGLDNVIEEVVAGKFDLAAHKAKQEKSERIERGMSAYLDQTLEENYTDQAKQAGASFVKECDDAEALNQVAWIILTHPRVKHRDHTVALAAARKAYELSKGLDPSIADTYARAHFDSGDKAQAIQYQKEAVALATEPKLKATLEATLKKYQGGK